MVTVSVIVLVLPKLINSQPVQAARHCITCTGTGIASRILHVSPNVLKLLC